MVARARCSNHLARGFYFWWFWWRWQRCATWWKIDSRNATETGEEIETEHQLSPHLNVRTPKCVTIHRNERCECERVCLCVIVNSCHAKVTAQITQITCNIMSVSSICAHCVMFSVHPRAAIWKLACARVHPRTIGGSKAEHGINSKIYNAIQMYVVCASMRTMIDRLSVSCNQNQIVAKCDGTRWLSITSCRDTTWNPINALPKGGSMCMCGRVLFRRNNKKSFCFFRLSLFFCILILFIQMKCADRKTRKVGEMYLRHFGVLSFGNVRSLRQPKQNQWNSTRRRDGILKWNCVPTRIASIVCNLLTTTTTTTKTNWKWNSIQVLIVRVRERAICVYTVTRRYLAKGKSCARKIGINFGRWHVNKSNEEHPLDTNRLHTAPYAPFRTIFLSPNSKWFLLQLTPHSGARISFA